MIKLSLHVCNMLFRAICLSLFLSGHILSSQFSLIHGDPGLPRDRAQGGPKHKRLLDDAFMYEPHFDITANKMESAVAELRGKMAYLHCKIAKWNREINVVWTRKTLNSGTRELLTSNMKSVYPDDDRIILSYREPLHDYLLLIKNVRPEDAGIYTCEIGHPVPLRDPEKYETKWNVNLTVFEMQGKIEIQKPVRLGQRIQIKCVIRSVVHMDPTKIPREIFWRHNGQPLKFQERKRYSENLKPVALHDKVTSSFFINDVQREDAGVYGCLAYGIKMVNATLVIDETTAAASKSELVSGSGAPKQSVIFRLILVNLTESLLIVLSLHSYLFS